MSEPAREPMEPIRGVVVPLDGSDLSEAAIGPAAEVAAAARVAITLTTVVSAGADVADREDYLAEVASRFVDTPAETQVLSGDDPGALIADLANERGALVSLGTHGRGRVSGAVLGTVAGGVVSRATGPVLVVGQHFEPWMRFEPANLIVPVD